MPRDSILDVKLARPQELGGAAHLVRLYSNATHGNVDVRLHVSA